jgi:uncharacterized protein (DUF779 family)
MTLPDRVTATPAAIALLAKLRSDHGPLMLHQSGGCCDGSSAQCFSRQELVVGGSDVFLGCAGETPLYITASQYQHWKHTQIILDVVEGAVGGFSLEAALGVRFISRARVFTDDEQRQLEDHPPPRGDQVDPKTLARVS